MYNIYISPERQGKKNEKKQKNSERKLCCSFLCGVSVLLSVDTCANGGKIKSNRKRTIDKDDSRALHISYRHSRKTKPTQIPEYNKSEESYKHYLNFFLSSSLAVSILH